MKQKKLIFGCLAGLLFMAFTAVNVTVSKSYQGDKLNNEFTLTQLVAKAVSAQEFYCVDDIFGGICTSLSGTDCLIPSDACYRARF